VNANRPQTDIIISEPAIPEWTDGREEGGNGRTDRGTTFYSLSQKDWLLDAATVAAAAVV
jgi:hypothetical protein